MSTAGVRLPKRLFYLGAMLPVLAGGLTYGLPYMASTLRLSEDRFRPGDIPTICFSSTGQLKQAAQLGDELDIFLCFSTLPDPVETSPFPPLFIGSINFIGSVELVLDEVTCNTTERFIQGVGIDPVTGARIEITNEVQLLIDKTSCDATDPPGGQGCGAGFWRQQQTLSSWPIPLSSKLLFGDIFEDAFPDMTLLEVLQQGGGSLEAMGRQAVAALLNAESATVDYDLTSMEVIDLFNDAFPGTNADYNSVANLLKALNNQGCGTAVTAVRQSHR